MLKSSKEERSRNYTASNDIRMYELIMLYGFAVAFSMTAFPYALVNFQNTTLGNTQTMFQIFSFPFFIGIYMCYIAMAAMVTMLILSLSKKKFIYLLFHIINIFMIGITLTMVTAKMLLDIHTNYLIFVCFYFVYTLFISILCFFPNIKMFLKTKFVLCKKGNRPSNNHIIN